MKRVVVTGVGVVSPAGNNIKDFWNNLICGKSCIDYITKFDASDFPVKIAGEVRNFDKLNYFDRKEARRIDDFIAYAVAATEEALSMSQLDLNKINKERAGVLIGSGIGGIKTIEEQHEILLKKGPKRISPFFVPMEIINMATGYVSIRYGFKGPNVSVVTACATGTHAIGEAFRKIQFGEADIMIAGGTEMAITPLGVAGFAAARALSTRNDEPKKASRPFEKNRDGFVMGEGAGVLILESLDHALKRGAPILAELVGYATTGDAYHITAPAPEGEGMARCMALALYDAFKNETKKEFTFEKGVLETLNNIQEFQDYISQVDYINAHGTSTKFNDLYETMAIKKVFKDRAYDINISSIKSMIGHLLGAAGGAECVASVLALKYKHIPPTINYEEPDPECDLNYTPNKAVKRDIRYVLKNNFGFGGTNACLVFKKFEE